ncbi:MAG TPA: POTRA domain-containing protein [Bryobacteraceae bacterium]|nr:POTRA domain-containing protein [Bryobacteraceae bacterium]HPQ13923.1 POTRA domain-containing protein [Bryobacteraceae bacterium]
MVVVVVFVFLFTAPAWAESGRLFLNQVKFEPRSEERPVEIKPGTSIDEKGANEAASALRRQLIAEGYRDAQVDAALVPAGFRRVNMRVHVNRGPLYRVDDVKFIGDPKLDIKKLKRAFRKIPYSDPAIESALAETRSLYISHGYFDAEVNLDHVKQDGEKITLIVNANAGKQYRMLGGGEFSARDVCACLFEFQRAAEKDGSIHFQARLEIDGSPEDGTVIVRPIGVQGPPFSVGRIEFRGNHAYGDLTLRRALKLDEGAVFDGELFRKSVSQLNDLKLFRPLTGQDIEIRPDFAARRADIIFKMQEGPRGKWALSGPVIPMGIAGGFAASVTSRLPGWGRGLLEASTYYFTFSMLGLPTMSSFLPFGNKATRWLPMVALARPPLPGQRWLSGFVISPQLGARYMLMSYGMSQTNLLIKSLLGVDGVEVPPLAVPVQWTSAQRPAKAGTLICKPQQSKWTKVRRIAALANDMAFGFQAF